MNSLTNIQQRWAHLNKKLSDPTVSPQGRAMVRVELAKLKPVLTEAFAAAADGSTIKTQAQPAETKAEPKAETLLQGRKALLRDFDFYVVPASQNLAVLVDKLFERWCATRKFRRAVGKPSRALGAERLQVYRKLIEGIVCNMVYAQAVNADGVSVSRMRGEYRAHSHYKPAIYTADSFLPLIDDCIEMHMLAQSLGDKWKRNYVKDFNITDAKYLTQHLKRTALHMTETLRELCAEVAIRFVKEEVGFMRTEQEVILQKHDESSALVEYAETPLTTKYREQMRQINRYLEKAGPLVAPEYADQWDDRQRFLTRKFTYSSFTSGGRLWGGFWDSPMRKEQRSAILRINGEATVELDYRNMIVRLAYILADEQAPAGDQYEIPGLSVKSRAGIKKLVSALLFDQAPNRKRFPSKGGDSKVLFTPEDQLKGFDEVLRAIKDHHTGIAHLFGSGVGHELQYLESKIMVNVLLRLGRMGITALPLHDCIIVSEMDADRAKEIMELVPMWVLGRVIPTDKK